MNAFDWARDAIYRSDYYEEDPYCFRKSINRCFDAAPRRNISFSSMWKLIGTTEEIVRRCNKKSHEEAETARVIELAKSVRRNSVIRGEGEFVSEKEKPETCPTCGHKTAPF